MKNFEMQIYNDLSTAGWNIFIDQWSKQAVATHLAKRGYRKQNEIVEDVLEKVKENLIPTISALFVIGEILVDESKSHISAEKALDDIRKELGCAISSKYRFEKMLEEIKKDVLEEGEA